MLRCGGFLLALTFSRHFYASCCTRCGGFKLVLTFSRYFYANCCARYGGFLLALAFSRHFHMICLTNSKNPPRIVNNPLKKWGKVPSPKSINAEMHWCFYKFQCYQIRAYFVKMYYMMIELEQVQRKEGVRL